MMGSVPPLKRPPAPKSPPRAPLASVGEKNSNSLFVSLEIFTYAKVNTGSTHHQMTLKVEIIKSESNTVFKTSGVELWFTCDL